MKVGFVGAGRWALALGLKLMAKGLTVALYEPDDKRLQSLIKTRRHPDLPENCHIPENIHLSSVLPEVVGDAEIVVFATPSAALATAAQNTAAHLNRTNKIVVSATKGIDPDTKNRLSVVLGKTIKDIPVVVLAGPGIPYDVALGDPTSLVAASEDESAAQTVRDTFTAFNLRVYSHSDVVGVEVASAFKNVIAIAAGIADGIGLGLNAKSALLTRGLAEIARLGLAFNANPLTFAGLAGMGDLIVTAFSPHSRNHQLGLLIGRGKEPAVALKELNGVAEGFFTARAGYELSCRMQVEMPITEEVFLILHHRERPEKSIERLLKRPPKKEFYQ